MNILHATWKLALFRICNSAGAAMGRILDEEFSTFVGLSNHYSKISNRYLFSLWNQNAMERKSMSSILPSLCLGLL